MTLWNAPESVSLSVSLGDMRDTPKGHTTGRDGPLTTPLSAVMYVAIPVAPTLAGRDIHWNLSCRGDRLGMVLHETLVTPSLPY